MNATPNRGARALDAFIRGPAVVALSLVLLVLVNWYAARRYTRFDWTSAGSFTLSSRSVEIVRGLREPVDLYALLARDEPLYADVSELAGALRRELSPGASALHRPRPSARAPPRPLARRSGLQLLQANNGERTLSTAGILVRRGARHWEVQRESLRELGQPDGDDEQGATRILNAKITVERSISEALLNVSQDRATKLCFTTGHAEMTLTRGARSGASLGGGAAALELRGRRGRGARVHGRARELRRGGRRGRAAHLVLRGRGRADSLPPARAATSRSSSTSWCSRGASCPRAWRTSRASRACSSPRRSRWRATRATCSPRPCPCTFAPTRGTTTRSPATCAGRPSSRAWCAPCDAPRGPTLPRISS